MSNLVTAEESSNISSSTSSSASSQFKYRIKLSQMADKRVVIVPVVFMLLKFWGIAVDIGIYFLPTHAKTNYRQNALSSVLVFLSVSLCYTFNSCKSTMPDPLQGIGSALPGFIHGLLFCALTREVRETMIKGLWNGITKCEVCFYDRCCSVQPCGCTKRRSENSDALLSNNSRIALTPDAEPSNFDIVSEYDIVASPDPTSSVLIVKVQDLWPTFRMTEQAS